MVLKRLNLKGTNVILKDPNKSDLVQHVKESWPDITESISFISKLERYFITPPKSAAALNPLIEVF